MTNNYVISIWGKLFNLKLKPQNLKNVKDILNICADKVLDWECHHNVLPYNDEESMSQTLICTFPITVVAYCEHNFNFKVKNNVSLDRFVFNYFSNITYFIIYQLLEYSVFPIHGATLIKDGNAVLLCGKSGVGKSTCYNASEGKWEQGSDDLAVVKRVGGEYWITPFPTWSNFTEDAKDTRKSWDISKSYPLKAIYLLQHGNDTIEKLKPIDSIMTFYDQISLFYKIFDFEKHIPEEHKEKLKTIFSISENISKELPAFKLNHKLGGKFLSLIEDSLEEL